MENNYGQMIYEQNEAEKNRRLMALNNRLTSEQRLQNRSLFATGVFAAGAVASMVLSGADPNVALETELKALSSWDSFKQFFTLITPAATICIIGAAKRLTDFIRHRRRANEIRQEIDLYQDEHHDEYVEENNEIIGKTR